MSWWQWLLVGLGIWGLPGTFLTLAKHGVRDGFSAVAERILFYIFLLWPILAWFLVQDIKRWRFGRKAWTAERIR